MSAHICSRVTRSFGPKRPSGAEPLPRPSDARVRVIQPRESSKRLMGYEVLHEDGIMRGAGKLYSIALAVDDVNYIGCRAEDANSGKVYGTVTDVSQTGVNDVWHITDDNGTETLIPAIPDVVSSVDVENGIVLITPLKGLFSDED